MTQDAIAAIITRNNFYQRLHYYALAVLAVAIIVIGIMMYVVYYISSTSGFPLYFATDNVGRLIKIVPVSQPNMNDDETIAWTVDAVVAAYSYDYINFRGQLQNAQKYFTPYGWTKYMDGLTNSGNLAALQANKWVQKVEVVDKPVILSKGLLHSGAYAWQIQMPLLVTYATPPYDAKSSYPLIIKVVVQRQSILQSYKGLGIAQFLGEVAKAPLDTHVAPISTTPS